MAAVSPTKRLLDLIGEAHAFDGIDAFREGGPGGLRPAVPADVGSYNEFDDDPSRVWWTSEPHLPISAELGARFAGLPPQTRGPPHPPPPRRGNPRRLSDFLSRDEYHETTLYQDFYRHVGVE